MGVLSSLYTGVSGLTAQGEALGSLVTTLPTQIRRL